MITLEAKLFGSGTSEPKGPAVIDFPGTTSRVEALESTRPESERFGSGTAEIDGLAGPEVITGMGKTTPSEVVIVGLAATISDERDPSSPFDFETSGNSFSPIEPEAPSPDCGRLAVTVGF